MNQKNKQQNESLVVNGLEVGHLEISEQRRYVYRRLQDLQGRLSAVVSAERDRKACLHDITDLAIDYMFSSSFAERERLVNQIEALKTDLHSINRRLFKMVHLMDNEDVKELLRLSIWEVNHMEELEAI